MPTVSEQLRQGREALGLTVQQVAEITKIRTDHVRALDEGNYDMFPAPVYIRGFVRNYATVLKLDVDSLMDLLESELSETEQFQRPPPLTPEPPTSIEWVVLQLNRVHWPMLGAAFVVALVLVTVVFSFNAWHHHKTTDPLAGLGPGIYQPKQDPAGQLLPLPATNAPRR